MKINLKKLGGAGILTLAAVGASPAFAAGADTNANTLITNSATLNYRVGGVNQNAITATNDIRVDRLVLVTVTEVNGAYTSVVPGQNGTVSAFNAAATTFTLTNNSNDTLDFNLSAANLVGVTGPFTGTDNFNPSGTYTFYRDNGNGVFDSADTLITFVDELAEDASVTIHVVNDISINQVNGDLAVVSLTATAALGGTAGTNGAVLTNDNGVANGALTVENVFNDVAGTDDVARDGRASARDGYRVDAPVLTVNKLSRVISDPVGGTTNPKAIPGAVVEYCITVANAAGGATATNVAISDVLPVATTYVSSFTVFEGGTVASNVCSGGTATGTYTAGTRTVAGNLGSIAASTTRTVYFRVTIN